MASVLGEQCPPKSTPTGTCECDLVGNRVFAHVISYDEGILVPFSEGTFGHRHTQRRDHVTTKAGTGVMLPQAKECEGVPAAHRGWEQQRDLPLEPSKGAWPCPRWTLHFFLASRTRREECLLFEAPQLVALGYRISGT